MKLPAIRGVIDRRILVNYRVRPDALDAVLPEPFHPKTVAGYGVGGICLIRLKHLRPPKFPAVFGLASENAAHRIAVEWEDDGETQDGVFIPRRDSSSRLKTILGGRIFSGVHHHASFDVSEGDGHFDVRMVSDDGNAEVSVRGDIAASLPERSVFPTIGEASAFFERGSLGYSESRRDGEYSGLELRTREWDVTPLSVSDVYSSYFEDVTRFDADDVSFDCALLMRDVSHEWHERKSMHVPTTA